MLLTSPVIDAKLLYLNSTVILVYKKTYCWIKVSKMTYTKIKCKTMSKPQNTHTQINWKKLEKGGTLFVAVHVFHIHVAVEFNPTFLP